MLAVIFCTERRTFQPVLETVKDIRLRYIDPHCGPTHKKDESYDNCVEKTVKSPNVVVDNAKIM